MDYLNTFVGPITARQCAIAFSLAKMWHQIGPLKKFNTIRVYLIYFLLINIFYLDWPGHWVGQSIIKESIFIKMFYRLLRF
jgi:hypothetical protein